MNYLSKIILVIPALIILIITYMVFKIWILNLNYLFRPKNKTIKKIINYVLPEKEHLGIHNGLDVTLSGKWNHKKIKINNKIYKSYETYRCHNINLLIIKLPLFPIDTIRVAKDPKTNKLILIENMPTPTHTPIRLFIGVISFVIISFILYIFPFLIIKDFFINLF